MGLGIGVLKLQKLRNDGVVGLVAGARRSRSDVGPLEAAHSVV